MSNLFEECLGDKFNKLAPLVRQAHTGSTRLVGDVIVERGNLMAQLICTLFGMPPSTPKCRLVVLGQHTAESMTWNRHFDNYAMNSLFVKDGDYVVERLGPIHMKMALDVADGILTYALAKTRVFGIPIPAFFSPRVTAVEQQVENKYRFSVIVAMPLIGKLVSYQGDMQVETIA